MARSNAASLARRPLEPRCAATDNLRVEGVSLNRIDISLADQPLPSQLGNVIQRLSQWGRIGAEFDASVLADLGGGQYLLRLAGGTVSVRSELPLQLGQSLRLMIVQQGERLTLQLLSSSVTSSPLSTQTAEQWLSLTGLPTQPPYPTALFVLQTTGLPLEPKHVERIARSLSAALSEVNVGKDIATLSKQGHADVLRREFAELESPDAHRHIARFIRLLEKESPLSEYFSSVAIPPSEDEETRAAARRLLSALDGFQFLRAAPEGNHSLFFQIPFTFAGQADAALLRVNSEEKPSSATPMASPHAADLWVNLTHLGKVRVSLRSAAELISCRLSVADDAAANSVAPRLDELQSHLVNVGYHRADVQCDVNPKAVATLLEPISVITPRVDAQA
jgi:hypothetical protein